MGMDRREHESTVAFLRMTASYMRELVDYAPEIARELRHVADQLEAEAADMESRKNTTTWRPTLKAAPLDPAP